MRAPRGFYKPRRQAAQAVEPEEVLDPRQQAIRDTERVIAAAKRALKIQKARGAGPEALQAFIELMMPDPEFPDDPEKSLFQCRPHHRILIEMVADVEAKRTMRGAVSMPPQHGKSLILSRFGLAWIMGRNPHLRALFATYSDGLATTRGDEVREVLQSRTFKDIFPRAGLRTGSQAKDEMAFLQGGSINFVGRGTATTGRPADLFFIDDPYKDEEEGSSELIRTKVKEWYSAVVFSRCHVLCPILIVHTRWNEDDLLGWLTDAEHPENRADPGRLLAADGTVRWKYVNLPTPVDDPKLAKALGLPAGSPLWPERFPLHHLAEAEKNNPRIYAALYKGQPSPADGDFFKAEHIQTYRPDELPQELRYFGASDHAVTEKQRNDASCLIPAATCRNDILWILPDVWWERKQTDVVVEAMLGLMERFDFLWWRAASDHISKSFGPFLRRRMLERKVFCNIVESPEAGDKVKKAQAIQARMAMGRVRFPAWAPWMQRARQELLKFPHGKHDDFVDALGHLGRGLRVMPAAAAPSAAANDDATPQPGTMGWIKWAAKQDRLGETRAARMRAM